VRVTHEHPIKVKGLYRLRFFRLCIVC
jgi:hypothetical protein